MIGFDGVYGTLVGEVDIRDFDLGIVAVFGGFIKNNEYVLNYGAELDGDVPIIFNNPDESLVKGKTPSMVILKDDINITTNRLQRGVVEYRLPSDIASSVVIDDTTGYSAYKVREVDRATDLTYSIQLYGHYRSQVDFFLKKVMEKLLLNDYITIKDSINNDRIYSAWVEGISKLDDFLSVTNRLLGYAITLRVEGELTFGSETIETGIIRTKIFRRVKL